MPCITTWWFTLLYIEAHFSAVQFSITLHWSIVLFCLVHYSSLQGGLVLNEAYYDLDRQTLKWGSPVHVLVLEFRLPPAVWNTDKVFDFWVATLPQWRKFFRAQGISLGKALNFCFPWQQSGQDAGTFSRRSTDWILICSAFNISITIVTPR